MKKWIIALPVLMLLTGCAKSIEPYRDAKVEHRNDKPAEVFTMPDGFSNVAGKCDGHGHRIYVAFKGDSNRAALAVVPDEACSR